MLTAQPLGLKNRQKQPSHPPALQIAGMSLGKPLPAVLGATALCVGGARWAFVASPASPTGDLAVQPRLRAGSGAAPETGGFFGALPSATVLALAAAAATGARAATSSVACRAAAVKKKGVRVVEGKEIPWNLFSPKAPYQGKVVENHKHPHTLSQETGDANWETAHVTFDHGGNVPYIEGQSIGVIAPGPDKKGETPAKIRLYSIASSAVGDNETSKTVSLCVKRVVEIDGKFANREVGEDKADKAGTHFPENKVYRGVCSNHICDMSPGDDVLITGPTGAEMLLPEDPEANIIMLATGTGIAPMRSYLRLLFNDAAGAAADGSRKFKGMAWLFMGVPYSKSLLYDDEHVEYKEKFPEQFRYDYAVSREQKNAAGQKMYIQTKMAEYAEELWDLMQKPNTHVYMCGLKGMESGMEECFSPLAEKAGLVWSDFAKAMKKAKRYHVEVY
mmetsp:Transcript_116540/g.362109  ORF Transcript_116540/g.362109 Transcript_116540/m.362109 type:complete len:448 (+) Transcript_116540:105-1448(+)